MEICLQIALLFLNGTLGPTSTATSTISVTVPARTEVVLVEGVPEVRTNLEEFEIIKKDKIIIVCPKL